VPKTSDSQIISAKLLLDTAKRQVKKSGLEKAFSVLHVHDALDWILQYLYESTLPSKKGKMMFPDYVSAISKHTDKFGSLEETKCDQLNTMRNNFKHNFVIPNDRQAEEIVLWAEIQIDSLVKTFTGKSLASFDTLEVIADAKAKERIKDADKSLGDSKRVEAFIHLAVAFDMLEYLKRQQVRAASGIDVPSSGSFTFSSSFFLKLDELGGRDFSRAWDKLIENAEYQNKMTSAGLMGVEYEDYIKFLTYTPRPQRSLNGTYHTDYSQKYAEQVKEFDYDFCRELVINTAVRNGL